MALTQSTLADEIRKISDTSFGAFAGFPASEAAARVRWGAAVRAYAEQMVTPPMPATAHDAAEAAFIAAFSPIDRTNMELALAAYASSLAQPAFLPPLYASVVPPPLPFVVPPLPATTDAAAAAQAFATQVDLWLRTGTWTLTSGPTGAWA